jgi:acid stress-induced BolA-like protein IbaG/YrbA
MDPAQIKSLIESELAGATAVVTTPDGTHFEAVVVAEAFSGKTTLMRHRLVYGALGERVGTDIHALSLQVFTPAEWSARQG